MDDISLEYGQYLVIDADYLCIRHFGRLERSSLHLFGQQRGLVWAYL